MKKRFIALDGMRGVCALTVFLTHLIPLHAAHGHTAIRHGYIAVDTFFMISGFVIAASYEQRLLNGLSTVKFLRARVRRLGPTYWLGMTLGAICWGVILIALSHIGAQVAVPSIVTLLIFRNRS